jgi:uncharacterized membrane protein YebE (DUF533 family)
MALQNLLNQFLGSGNVKPAADNGERGLGDTLGKLTGNLPGGLIGGAAAGGIMALMANNRKARRFAGKAATYGGAAVIGGLAYRALQNWQQDKAQATSPAAGPATVSDVKTASLPAHSADFDLAVIKAMIAAARADGHTSDLEQQRIFKAVGEMDLSTEMKALVFDLLGQSITVEEITRGIESLEEKSELYLASCLVIDPDHPREFAHLDELARALELPKGLPEQLQSQAQKALRQAV